MAETLDDVQDTKLIPDEARAAPVVVPDPPPTDGKTVTPASVAFSACRRVVTSWNTKPP